MQCFQFRAESASHHVQVCDKMQQYLTQSWDCTLRSLEMLTAQKCESCWRSSSLKLNMTQGLWHALQFSFLDVLWRVFFLSKWGFPITEKEPVTKRQIASTMPRPIASMQWMYLHHELWCTGTCDEWQGILEIFTQYPLQKNHFPLVMYPHGHLYSHNGRYIGAMYKQLYPSFSVALLGFMSTSSQCSLSFMSTPYQPVHLSLYCLHTVLPPEWVHPFQCLLLLLS